MNKKDEYVEMVSRPGKFEGEAPWVPYYWHITEALEPIYDESTWDKSIIGWRVEINSEDTEIFPELAEFIGRHVILDESEAGFVYGMIEGITPAQAERAAGRVWMK